MEIRRLTESDYDEFIELYMALSDLHADARPDCFLHRSKEEAYPKDAFLHNVTYPDCIELGVFEGGHMAGFVEATLWEESVEIKGVKTVCLDNIYVTPACRRRGIAAKLFAMVEEWAKEQGAVRLDVYAWSFNTEAISMYQTMGMTAQRCVFEKKL